MSLDTDVLIIGAGMSGLGLAVQLVRQYGHRKFELIEKSNDVGGTWLANTYPGCGCDVASHFYSYSFALNPDWSEKYSMGPEIQAYFRGVADGYNIVPHIRFHSMVQTSVWDDREQCWVVTIRDNKTKQTYERRAKILVSAVGSLSVPNKCEIPGVDAFNGPLFHSAQWDHSFDWQGKDVVVLGNGCSATQFVPIMSGGPNATAKLTQFARQAHYIEERLNPTYSSPFKALMRYMPLAMRFYRFLLYADLEKDFASFDIETGAKARQVLKKENEAYVKRMAPQRYWDALIPKHEIGCKRKVKDTGYLECLWRKEVELVYDDPVQSIEEDGVRTKSGRFVKADAIVLAVGFATSQILSPMHIVGQNDVSLNDHWDTNHKGAAQAYLGTCIPNFPNFFTLMGPNTVTGHLSVIYTVECQINFILRLIEPILNSLRPSASLTSSAPTSAVAVKPEAAMADSTWTQRKLSKLVWASGCTSWALDPQTGLNIAMYPEYQFMFWWRSIFIRGQDFEYMVSKTGTRRSLGVGGWKALRDLSATTIVIGLLAGSAFAVHRSGGLRDIERTMGSTVGGVTQHVRGLLG